MTLLVGILVLLFASAIVYARSPYYAAHLKSLAPIAHTTRPKVAPLFLAGLHVHSKKATVRPKPRVQVIPEIEATIPPAVRGSVFSQGHPSHKEIALTFDDGPNPTYTPQVLAILQRYGVKATFFCIGRQIPSSEALVHQLAQAGEEVGNHTWDHYDLTQMDASGIASEIASTSTVIQQATGKKPALFRAPYGALNGLVLHQAAAQSLVTVSWSVDTLDWQRRGVESIVQAALGPATNGSIILMHDGGGDRAQTVQALPQIIEGLQARGYTLVTVRRLIVDSLHA